MGKCANIIHRLKATICTFTHSHIYTFYLPSKGDHPHIYTFSHLHILLHTV